MKLWILLLTGLYQTSYNSLYVQQVLPCWQDFSQSPLAQCRVHTSRCLELAQTSCVLIWPMASMDKRSLLVPYLKYKDQTVRPQLLFSFGISNSFLADLVWAEIDPISPYTSLNHFLKSRQHDLRAYCSNIYILSSCCSCNTTAYAASQTAEIGFGEKEAKIDAFGQLQKRSIRFALRQRRRHTAPPQPAQPLAYLHRCIVAAAATVAAVAAAAILLCFRLLTSVTTDYS